MAFDFLKRTFQGTRKTADGKGSRKLGADPIDWGKVGDTAADGAGMLVDPAMTFAQQAAQKRSIRDRANILRKVPRTNLPGVVHNIRGPQGLTYGQKQTQLANIAGMRSQYKGSDPTMALIGNNMNSAGQLQAQNKLAGDDASMYRQDLSRYDAAVDNYNTKKFQRDAQQASMDSKYLTDRALIDSGQEKELQAVRNEGWNYGRTQLDNAAKYSQELEAMDRKNAITKATDALAYARQYHLNNAGAIGPDAPKISEYETGLDNVMKQYRPIGYFRTRGSIFRKDS